jgi:ribosomal protein S18 acetylase RimI-like enzyme
VNEATYERHAGEQTLTMLEELVTVYRDARIEDPDRDDPLFSGSQFTARTEAQSRRAGFELVTARVSGTLVGFSFGYPFQSRSWWTDASAPPEPVLQATKFAVIELDVGRAYQGRGLGRTLLDTLLSQRSEDYATLATIPGSSAQAMYERWGWYSVGSIGGDGPVMDAMLKAL